MKKLLFILISAFFIMNTTNAQAAELVDANTYCNSPSKYNGKTITVKNVIIKSFILLWFYFCENCIVTRCYIFLIILKCKLSCPLFSEIRERNN